MDMATKQITVEIDDLPINITIKSARKADGLRRADLMVAAAALPDIDIRKNTAFYEYPTCVCAVAEPAWVRDMSVEDFINRVGEGSIETWINEAYEINPQWKQSMRALFQMSAEQEKKLGTSLNGSEQPMEAPQTSETSPVSKS